MEKIIQEYLPKSWSKMNSSENYKLVKIKRHSKLFKELLDITNCYDEDVYSIYRIQNPKLYAQYLLKKAEYELVFKTDDVVKQLFHCTHIDNLDSIADSNLDYRQVSRGKFGNGVSFTPDPDYAHQYSSSTGCIIVADVLIGSTSTVKWPYWPGYDLPPYPADTTLSSNSKVYVKYHDNEFYPEYAVYYDD